MTHRTLKQRAAVLRLSNAELARLAGVDKHTVGRVLSGRRDALHSKVAAIAAAIAREETIVHGALAQGPRDEGAARRGGTAEAAL